ncbi:hypothetical protein P3342_004610 [Pyrenophora teres f. teres]|uniref:Uncharacterized protein n=1 Tax=Pyrenophora teres f. teres TaxID=97479 RepID=A0A6S6VWC2_9PLEO|nr:hypothetical protein P3342_004610 [Pyrenophora teres f. teres]CAE7020805.1 hypothetical protein PTTW11_03145 [Pyrenophora teres f. teres]
MVTHALQNKDHVVLLNFPNGVNIVHSHVNLHVPVSSAQLNPFCNGLENGYPTTAYASALGAELRWSATSPLPCI